MPERVVRYSEFLSASDDKGPESGLGAFIEFRGLAPRLPGGQGEENSALAVAGYLAAGDAPYAFVPGGHKESQGSEDPEGERAAPGQSFMEGKVRRCSFSFPSAKGDIVAEFYSGSQKAGGAGRCLGLYQELWGEKPPVGDSVEPYPPEADGVD